MDTYLSTVILVSFLVTIVMAIGSYVAYKLRETRGPGVQESDSTEESPFFERILAEGDRADGTPGPD